MPFPPYMQGLNGVPGVSRDIPLLNTRARQRRDNGESEFNSLSTDADEGPTNKDEWANRGDISQFGDRVDSSAMSFTSGIGDLQRAMVSTIIRVSL